jgi:stage V sporulation protein B
MRSERVTGTIYLTVASLAYMVSGYFLSVWLGRFLGPEKYGEYGVIISLMTLINLVQTSGLPQATAKFIAEKSEQADAIFKRAIQVQLILAIVLMVVLGFLAIPSAHFLGDNRLASYIAATALILPLYGLYSIYIGYYNGLHLFKKQAIINIAYSVAKMAFVVILTIYFGLAGAIAGFVIAPLAAILTGGFYPKGNAAHFPAKQLVGLSVPLIIFSVLSMLQMSSDIFLVKKLIGEDKWTGYYVAAQNISLVLYLGLSAFSQMILPGIAKAFGRSDPSEASKLLGDAYRYLLIGLLPLTALFIAESHELITILYSPVYSPGSAALSILAAAYAALTIYVLSANSMNGAGKPKYSNIISALGVVTTVVIAWNLIPTMGIRGAAMGTLAGAVVAMILGLIATRLLIKPRFSWLTLARVSVMSLIVYLEASYFKGTGIMHLLLVSIVTGATYVAGLWTLREISKDEISHLKQIAGRGKS